MLYIIYHKKFYYKEVVVHTKIKTALDELNIVASDEQVELWISYLKLLEKWNKVYNMTAIKKIDDMS